MIDGLDPGSQTWMAIKTWAEQKIAEARDAMEQTPGGEDRQRGRCDLARELLALVDKPGPKIQPRSVAHNAR